MWQDANTFFVLDTLSDCLNVANIVASLFGIGADKFI
jgi:hypothetical protein